MWHYTGSEATEMGRGGGGHMKGQKMEKNGDEKQIYHTC